MVRTTTRKRDQPQMPQHLQLLPNLRLNMPVPRMEPRQPVRLRVNIGQ